MLIVKKNSAPGLEKQRGWSGGVGLVLAGEGDGGEDGIVGGADGREIFFQSGKGEDADGGAAAGVDALEVDGRAVLGAVADFEGDGFGGAGNGWREGGIDFWFAEIFAEHLGLRLDILGESNAGAKRLFHRADVAGEGVLYILLNAKTFLDLPTVGDLLESPMAYAERGGRAGALRWCRHRGHRRLWNLGGRARGGSSLGCR